LEKRTYLIIVRYAPDIENTVADMLKAVDGSVKNKTMSQTYSETTAEVRVRKGDTSFVDDMKKTEGVETVTLVEYTGDQM
jgi:hypothetical protein